MQTTNTHAMDANAAEKRVGSTHELEHEGADKLGNEPRVVLTDEDNRRLCRKTDKRILTVLCWIYFLQIFDKVVFGLGNTFGLTTDLGMTGDQYSFAGSIHAIAQLGWQPFSSYLIVRVPARTLMTCLVFAWGTAAACMAAATSYQGIYVARFFLGLFEAGCLPLFSVITAQWYRRSEQPLRVALWYGTNGIATIVAGFMAFGLGHINGSFKAWQALYLFAGLLTVLSAPLVWFRLDNDIQSARFFTEEEKLMAVERLRANQTGTGSREWKWSQVIEVFIDPKSYLWIGIAMLPNLGASVTNVFGPTLLKNFGFDKFISTLLTTPFGFLQTVAILIGCYCAQKFTNKSGILAGMMAIALVGTIMLYTQSSAAATAATLTQSQQAISLAGYYLLAFLYAGNPLIVSWVIANTAGQTKKSVIMSLYNAASSAGNIVGPLLFKAADAPRYVPGVQAVMIIFIVLIVIIGVQVAILFIFNKQRQRQRVARGLPKIIHDTSMESKFQAYGEDEGSAGKLGEEGLHDVSDVKNPLFTYVY